MTSLVKVLQLQQKKQQKILSGRVAESTGTGRFPERLIYTYTVENDDSIFNRIRK